MNENNAPMEAHVKHLAQSLDLPTPAPVNGCYTFDFEDALSLNIAPFDKQGFQLSAWVFSIDTKTLSEELMQGLLEGNLFGQLTSGATLSWDAASSQLKLQKNLYQSINSQEFVEEVEDFLNALEFWQQEIPEKLEQQSKRGPYE